MSNVFNIMALNLLSGTIDFKSQAFADKAVAALQVHAEQHCLIFELLQGETQRLTYATSKTFTMPLLQGPSLVQAIENFLEEAYEASYVNDERDLFARAVKNTVPMSCGTSDFAPDVLVALRRRLTEKDMPTGAFLIGMNVWNSLLLNSDFHHHIDAETREFRVAAGHLGTIFGCNLYTDFFRPLRHRILQPNDIWAVTSSEHLGRFAHDPNSPIVIECPFGNTVNWKVEHKLWLKNVDLRGMALVKLVPSK